MKINIDTDIELILIAQSDAKDIFYIIDNEREYLKKWLPFIPYTKQVSDTEKYIALQIKEANKEKSFVFTIRKAGQIIGLIGLKDIDKQNRKTEIGYWISEKFQKQGIVTKSTKKLCDYAFEKLNMNRIQIKCAVGNKASANIPKRLNFKFEGIERQGELLSNNTFSDLEIYAKLNKK